MANEVNLQEITGTVSLEDQFTGAFEHIIHAVGESIRELDGVTGALGIAALAATGAIAGAVASITALGIEGSTILGVEEAFDKLAIAAGTTGDALREGLREGVKGTIDDFNLMQSASRLMASGMKITEDQTRLLGEAARAMGKATGTDAAQGLDVLNQALLTGRTRALAQAGILIDVKDAEEDFAKSIGASADQLNKAGKIEAARIAILKETQEYVERLGETELSFKERIAQVRVGIEEWGESLAKSVASSPHVTAAFDAISAAISKTFGGAGQTALETITDLIDKFADSVTEYAPVVVDAIGDIVDAISDLFKFLKDNSDTIKALAIGVGAYATAWGLMTAGGAIVSGVVAGLEAITTAAAVLEAGSLVTLINPIGAVAVAVGVLAIAVYKFKQSLGDIENRGKSTGKALDGLKDSTGHAKMSIDDAKAALDKMGASAQDAGVWSLQLKTHVEAAAPVLDNHRFLNDKLSESAKKAAEEQKRLAEEFSKLVVTMSGAGAINKAQDYMAAVQAVGNVTMLTEKEQANLNSTLGEAIEVYRRLGIEAPQALLDIWAATNKLSMAMGPSSFQNLPGQIQFPPLPPTAWLPMFSTLPAGLKASVHSNRASLDDAVMSVFGDIPSLMVRAFTGGGGISGAMQAIGSDLGAQIGGHFQHAIQDSFKDSGKVLGGLTKVFSDALPVIGSLVGPAIGLISKLFNDPEKQINPTREAFVQLHGGLAQLNADAARAGTNVWALLQAKNADQYKKAVDDLTKALADFDAKAKAASQSVNDLAAKMKDVTSISPELQAGLDAAFNAQNLDDYQKALKKINDTIDDQNDKQKHINDLIDKYGLNWQDAGTKFKQAQIDSMARDLVKDFTDLHGVFDNLNPVMEGMKKPVQDFVDAAQAAGLEVPDAMQQVIQSAIDAGTLYDKNGKQITEMKDLGLTFGKTMEQTMSDVAASIEKLIKVLTDKLAPSIADATKDRTIHINYEYEPFNPPNRDDVPGAMYGGKVGAHDIVYLASGGRPRGTDTVPAMLSPGEGVVTTAGMNRLGDGGLSSLNRGGGLYDPAVKDELVAMRSDMLRDRREFPRTLVRALSDAKLLKY